MLKKYRYCTINPTERQHDRLTSENSRMLCNERLVLSISHYPEVLSPAIPSIHLPPASYRNSLVCWNASDAAWIWIIWEALKIQKAFINASSAKVPLKGPTSKTVASARISTLTSRNFLYDIKISLVRLSLVRFLITAPSVGRQIWYQNINTLKERRGDY